MAHGAKSPVGMPRCSRRHFQLIFAGAAVKPLSDLRGEPGSGVWGGCATSVTGVGARGLRVTVHRGRLPVVSTKPNAASGQSRS